MPEPGLADCLATYLTASPAAQQRIRDVCEKHLLSSNPRIRDVAARIVAEHDRQGTAVNAAGFEIGEAVDVDTRET
jgi:hypothetical protein